jgi:hypothetical protein
MMNEYLKIAHSNFLPHPLQFTLTDKQENTVLLNIHPVHLERTTLPAVGT